MAAEIFPVVMAGGSGTRFWPLSRSRHPKQLLKLSDPHRTMLQLTVERLLPLSEAGHVLVVTGQAMAAEVAANLPDVPSSNILAEPVGRNTLPCVGWAALHVRRLSSEGILAVVPADHHIEDVARFRQVVQRAVEAADEQRLVTIGLRPTHPETGYGYIEVGEEERPGVHRAVRFVEKPKAERAQAFLASGRYVWNSGMFFFSAEAVLKAIERHQPEMFQGLKKIEVVLGQQREEAVVGDVYEHLPALSIDHGIMEKADDLLVCPGDFGWNDIGSWAAAHVLRAGAEAPEANVLVTDEAVLVDASGCLVWTQPNKLVALVGVQDLVVVDTGDALLVCPRDQSQRVREVVAALRQRGRQDLT